jgi:LPS-assembly protein
VPVDVTADHMQYESKERRSQLEGHAQLRSGKMLMHGDEMTYDAENKQAHAQGNVTFTEGLLAATALSVDIDLLADVGHFQNAVLMQKSATTPVVLASVSNPHDLHLVGRNDLTLKAKVVERISPEHFIAEKIWLSPCDCRNKDGEEAEASWSVRARRADMIPGERLILTVPVIYVPNLPILGHGIPLPALYLPLSDRHTGFLLPRPNYTANNGFQLEEPFFWAINEWSDATFTPGYFFGQDNRVPCSPLYEGETCTSNGKVVGSDNPGIQGPRLGMEYRYIPSETTHGKLTGALVYDLKPKDIYGVNPQGLLIPVKEVGHRGVRGDLVLSHDQLLGAGFSDHVELSGVSDRLYFRDITTDLVAASNQYLRSNGRVDYHTASSATWLDATYFQDLLTSAPTSGPTSILPPGSLGPYFGPNDVNRFTFQRLPELGFMEEERKLGPFGLSLEARVDRFAPLQEQSDRGDLCPIPAYPPQPPPGQAQSSYWLPPCRQVTERLDLAPELRLPIPIGRFGELSAYAQVREDAWFIEGSQFADRTYLLLGAVAQSELARIYNFGGVRWRHVLTPNFELRSLPWLRGSQGPAIPNDEIDQAVSDPNSPQLLQGIVSLKTRVDRKEGTVVTTPFRAEVGQGVDLLNQKLADSFASVSYVLGLLQMNALARYDWTFKTLNSLQGRVAAISSRGDMLALTYLRYTPGLTDPMRASLTDLVGPPVKDATQKDWRFQDEVDYERAESLDLSGRWRPSVFLLEGGITVLPHLQLATLGLQPSNEPAPDVAADKAIGLLPPDGQSSIRAHRLAYGILGYRLGLGYTSPCNCWGIHANAYFQPAADPSGAFSPGSFFKPVNLLVTLEAQRIGGGL